VRKLLLPIVPACLIFVPSVVLAAPDTGAAGSSADVSLVPSPTFVADPFHPVEARSQAREAVMEAKRKSRPKRAPAVTVSPALEAIAACESGGDPAAVSSTGTYRGKYQFSTATWQAVGGTGDPAAAPEAEQDLRATILYEQSGPGQWPVCG
jgi:hypothetical protein